MRVIEVSTISCFITWFVLLVAVPLYAKLDDRSATGVEASKKEWVGIRRDAQKCAANVYQCQEDASSSPLACEAR